MNDKKPTERVVPATSSARGSSLLSRSSDDHQKPGVTLAADADECKPLAAAARESFARRSGDTPLTPRAFFQLKDALYAAAVAAFAARWGSRRARLNKSLLRLVEVLLGHGQFALGARVAFSTTHLAQVLHIDDRTVTRAIGKLERWPELVTVLRVQRGELAWDGRRAFREHLEWELGPALQSVGDQLLGRPLLEPHSGTVHLNPRHPVPDIPGNVPPDPPLDLTNDQILKSENAPHHDNDRPNFQVDPTALPSPIPPAAERSEPSSIQIDHPVPEANSPRSPRPDDNRGTRTGAVDTALGSALLPSFPAVACPPPKGDGLASFGDSFAAEKPLRRPDLADAVIRQHRELAEHKGRFVPIAGDELRIVDDALVHLSWCRTDRERLELCARVSELAARDSAVKGHTRASLRFTFGRRDTPEPHRFFLERVARLREHDEQLAKERLGAELVAAFGARKPPVKARAAPCPPLGKPRPDSPPVRARRPPDPRNSSLSPSELLEHIAQCTARMNQPNIARAG